jgi:ankyrin repeat protein
MKFDLLDECFNGTLEDVRSLLAKNKYSIKYLSQALAQCAATLLPLNTWVGHTFLTRPARPVRAVSLLLHWLVEYGARFDVPHYDGTPALHYICAVQDVELFQFALKHGADLHAVDRCGQTVAHFIARYAAASCASSLSDVRAREVFGRPFPSTRFLDMIRSTPLDFLKKDNGGTYPHEWAPAWLQRRWNG